jgi:hypothetical protein
MATISEQLVCYVVSNDYMVTGDNVIMVDGKYNHFVEQFNMDTPRLVESLKGLPEPRLFRYILTGQYGIAKIR